MSSEYYYVDKTLDYIMQLIMLEYRRHAELADSARVQDRDYYNQATAGQADRNLSYGFLTGILRVAKENIFSGLNNLTVNSILDNKYSEYFRFTPSEVRELAAYYAAGDKCAELCAWYDGCRFGNSDIFNPWSVINYFRNDCQPRPYWQATDAMIFS